MKPRSILLVNSFRTGASILGNARRNGSRMPLLRKQFGQAVHHAFNRLPAP